MHTVFLIMAGLLYSADGGEFGFLGGDRPGIQTPFFNITSPFDIPDLDEVKNFFVEQWDDFEETFKKHYDSVEATIRKTNFLENIEYITNFTKDTAHSFGMKINEFADLTFKEFDNLFHGFNRNGQLGIYVPTSRSKMYEPPRHAVLPRSVDWRKEGVVTSVKNQKPCKGCWAFSAIAALESHIARKTGKLPRLSAQHLIDCATGKYDNTGCKGGLIDSAFDFVVDNGISKTSAYPFAGIDGDCQPNKKKAAVKCQGFVVIPPGDENALAKAVAFEGPVAAAIHVTNRGQFYAERVFEDSTCSSEGPLLNHAILIVGYGVEENGKKYWLIKNSYGISWGLKGYFKLAKDKGNMCGIATYARFPIV